MKNNVLFVTLHRRIASKWWAKIIWLYTAISLIYIYISDSLVSLMTRNNHLLAEYQTIKGVGFIFATSVFMVYLTKGNVRKTTDEYAKVLQDEKEHAHKKMFSLEQKYMQLFNHIPLPMWIFDCETLEFLQVNNAAIKKYGYTAEEFAKMTLRDIRPMEEQEALDKALKTVMATDAYCSEYSFRHILKNGTNIFVKIESIATTYEGRSARLVLSMDITKEMNMQQELRTVNNMLRSASEIANLGYWSNDFKTGKIHWSEELHKIFGTDPKTFELTLDNISNRFAPESRFEFTQDIGIAYESGEVKESERKILTPEGEKWILQRITLEKDKDGTPYILQGITIDITARKENERALQESNTRYKMVMQASVDAMIDWDIEKNETYWGANFRELFGHEIANYGNNTWMQFIHPEDKKRVKQELKLALANKKQEYFYTRFRFLKADAQIAYIKQKGVFVRNAEGRAIRAVGAMIDVTESVQHLQFIEQQNASLKEIAWVQSHVVRGPLSTLMGLVDLLKHHKQYDINPDDLIPDIASTANKLDDVIKVIVRKSECLETNSATGQTRTD